jgi:hypothetical protein
VGVESKLGPLGTSAIYWPIVPAPGDCEDGEFGGINGRGNRSTRRKPAPTPLCPPRIPLDQIRDWTRVAVVGSQRLTASAMAWPGRGLMFPLPIKWTNRQYFCSANTTEFKEFRCSVSIYEPSIKEDKRYTSVHCEKMASVINCGYCETVGLLEKILFLVLILKMFPNSCLCLVLTWKGHYCTCIAKRAQYFLHILVPLPFSTLFRCAVSVPD